MDLTGRTMLVAGAASGRGDATAQERHAGGANVVMVDLDGSAAGERPSAHLNGEVIRLDGALRMPPR